MPLAIGHHWRGVLSAALRSRLSSQQSRRLTHRRLGQLRGSSAPAQTWRTSALRRSTATSFASLAAADESIQVVSHVPVSVCLTHELGWKLGREDLVDSSAGLSQKGAVKPSH